MVEVPGGPAGPVGPGGPWMVTAGIRKMRDKHNGKNFLCDTSHHIIPYRTFHKGCHKLLPEPNREGSPGGPGGPWGP